MSDLRTRIAAALARTECEDRCGTTFEARPCLGCLERCIPQADAVIRELGADYEDDPYEAKADAERQQWADDKGMPR